METIEFVSKLAQELAVALLPVLAVFLMRWIKVKGDQVLARIEKEKPDLLGELTWIAGIAVKAAEQAGAAGFVNDKKVYAVAVVQDYLRSKNIPVDFGLISAAVEAAVMEEFNQWKTRPTPEE